MANGSVIRVGVITAVQFVAALAIVLRPADGWAQSGVPAEFKPTFDQKVDARPVPAKVTSEMEAALAGSGYIEIGTVSASQAGDLTNPQIVMQLESAVLQRAADAGGDLVRLTQSAEVEDREVSTGKRTEKLCSHWRNTSVADGRGGYKWVSVCDSYSGGSQITATAHFLVTRGSVWRNDPKIASELPMSDFILLGVFDDVAKMKALLNADPALVVKRDKSGSTLLHRAAGFFSTGVTEFLLAKGADVNARDNDGSTPLHAAAQKGSKKVVEVLLAAGADLNAQDQRGDTPLNLALLFGKTDVAALLVARGADVNARDQRGCTPLFYAAPLNHMDIAELLLAHGADVNAKNNVGQTLLHEAASNTNVVSVAVWLLAKGLDINARDASGQTPLHLARYYQRKLMEKWLVQHGAHE